MTTSSSADENEKPNGQRWFLSHGSWFERFRRHFIAGLLVLVPALIAGYAVVFIMNGADAIFGEFVLRLFGLGEDDPLSDKFYIQAATKFISFLLALFIVIAVGYLSTFFIVRRLITIGEAMVNRVPFVKFFYNTPKEVISTFTLQKNSFQRVVMVEYPRRGMWCLAFATGEVRRRPDNMDLIAIFLPTTPNPTSGFLIYLPGEDILDTNIPVEQGARMIISGGILSPDEICTQKFQGINIEPNLPPLGSLTLDEVQAIANEPEKKSADDPID